MKVVDENTLEMKEMENDAPLTQKDKIIEKKFKKALGNCNPEEFNETYKKYKTAKEEFDKLYEPIKKELLKLYKEEPEAPRAVIIKDVTLRYISPSTRTSIDSKKLKEEEPEIAKKYTKETDVSATLRIEET
ncbi:MAG: hypothetical protein K2P14_03550 [Anaeroplasmataceae bacterium]|nr:hypothetical protein [Anaeroplasmataceae bacterium]